jgi:hypothetical protein
MIALMHKFRWFFLFLVGGFVLSVMPRTANAQADESFEVVAAVNAFRAANGLAPLLIDPILMSIAQAHSDYQASIGTVTHYGPGNSRPKDRATAAGFGGGATVFLSENIAGGRNMSIDTAIYQYWQDELHLYTMLNPAAVYIGAGVGRVGDYVYYTVDAGYFAGALALEGQSPPSSGNADPGPTAEPYDPFVVSTPRGDGAVVHVVGFGQSLIGIANTYAVPVNDLLVLNGLTLDSVIYVGEEIIIKAGTPQTATFTPTVTVEPTITPSPTATALKYSPTPRASFTPRVIGSATPSVTPTAPSISVERQRLVVGIALMALVVFVLVLLTSFFQGTKPEPPPAV